MNWQRKVAMRRLWPHTVLSVRSVEMSAASSSLSVQQKKLVRDFRNVTGGTEKVAEELLRRARWSLEGAVELFYSSASARASAVKLGDEAKLNSMFDKYSDQSSPQEMSSDGLLQFFSDIDVDPTGVLSIAIAWKLDCKQMGVIQRAEFVKALSTLGIDTTANLIAFVQRLKTSLEDLTVFKQMHKWVFHFVKGGEQKRSIEKEMAVELLRLLIDSAKYPLIDHFLEFLMTHKDKGVPRDVWEMTLEFVATTKADLSNFDENGAWPVIMDEFVAWYRKKL